MMKLTNGFRWTGARLQLFGSSKNGFGFRQSDLDICMVREGQETIDVSFVFFFPFCSHGDIDLLLWTSMILFCIKL